MGVWGKPTWCGSIHLLIAPMNFNAAGYCTVSLFYHCFIQTDCSDYPMTFMFFIYRFLMYTVTQTEYITLGSSVDIIVPQDVIISLFSFALTLQSFNTPQCSDVHRILPPPLWAPGWPSLSTSLNQTSDISSDKRIKMLDLKPSCQLFVRSQQILDLFTDWNWVKLCLTLYWMIYFLMYR